MRAASEGKASNGRANAGKLEKGPGGTIENLFRGLSNQVSTRRGVQLHRAGA